MLRIICGPAHSGKTSRIMAEICERASAGETGQVLIVPEQFSHDAERELCMRGGDSISLYAEVLTFKRLSNRILSEAGGISKTYFDEGGRLLAMQLAVKTAEPGLEKLRGTREKPEFLKGLVGVIDELKSSRITPAELFGALTSESGGVSDKLMEVSLIYEAYEAVCAHTEADPREELEIVAEAIKKSHMLDGKRVYFDAYTGFTRQEMEILHGILKKAEVVTVAITADNDPDGENEGLKKANDTIRRLESLAKRDGHGVTVEQMPEKAGREDLDYLARNLYDYSAPQFDGQAESIFLSSAADVYSECVAAADRILSLVRSGTRFRDIAVVARGFDRYRATIEGVFERYGIPLFTGEKSDILEKPVLMFVSAALDVVCGDFSYDDIFRYLKSGLCDIEPSECDMLENYVLSWDIKGSAWRSDKPWRFHPSGRHMKLEEEDTLKLKEINDIRDRVRAPLLKLRQAMRGASSAREFAVCLYDFMEECGLYDRIVRRQEGLVRASKKKEADEYRQLWGIICRVLEQCAGVLGDMSMTAEGFSSLFTTCLSAYNVGTIPVSIDRVIAGDADRTGKRGARYVFVLGANEGYFPFTAESGGILTDEDRLMLENLGMEIGMTPDRRLAEEAAIVYGTLTMPSEGLYISYPRVGSDGARTQPSAIFTRIALMFGLKVHTDTLEEHLLSVKGPLLELAMSEQVSLGEKRGYAKAAKRYLLERAEPDFARKLERAESYASRERIPLDPERTRRLYGRTISLSASRMDSFRTCAFQYFCRYGLRARPRVRAVIEASDAGTFMHYVLENAMRQVMREGGFKKISKQRMLEIAREYAQKFVEEMISGYEDKGERYKYIFARLMRHVERISENMADELKNSGFEPLDFELRFAKDGDLPPIQTNDGEASLSGIVDRVDGWEKDGKLYVRVIDYKSGIKKFSLGDIYNGLGLQMLIYLFALQESGKNRYGREIVPAGALYVPVREEVVRAERGDDEEKIDGMIEKTLRRSGLILGDTEVIEAMEGKISGDGRYLPVKVGKDGEISATSSTADEVRFEKLKRHVYREFEKIAREIKEGCISANPVYRGKDDTACRYCDYKAACLFNPTGKGKGGDAYRTLMKVDRNLFWEKLDQEESGEGGIDHGLSTD